MSGTTLLRALGILLATVLSARNVSAGLTGDVEQLLVVADAHQANRDKIQTWQGEAEVLNQYGTEPSHRRLVHFAYDAESDSHFWKWSLPQNGSEREQEWFRRNSMNGMVRDGRLFEYRRLFSRPKLAEYGTGPAYQLHIRKWNGTRTGGTPYFCARAYLDVFGVPNIEDSLRWYHGQAGSRLLDGSVQREADLVIFIVLSKEATVRHVYDLSKGGNLIERHWQWKSIVRSKPDTMRMTWREIDGIWVPDSYDSHHTPANSEEIIYQVNWQNQQLNEPVPDGTFSAEPLGLVPGDRIVNTIDDERSTYAGGDAP